MIYRYEKKFLVEERNSSLLQKYLRLSPYQFKIAFPERKVFSIYYDTPSLTFYYSNLEGDASRIKVRTRKYPYPTEVPNQYNLELKCKQGEVGYKKTSKINLRPDLKLDLKILTSLIDTNLDMVLAKHLVGALIPTVSILYTREYYVSLDQKIRLTVDRDFLYSPPTQNLAKLSKLSNLNNAYVVEIKYNSEDAGLINKYSEDLPFRQEKNSKYIKAYSALRGEIL